MSKNTRSAGGAKPATSTQPPVTNPPASDQGATEAPVVTPPAADQGTTEAPVVTPPAADQGTTEAPVVTPPAADQGKPAKKEDPRITRAREVFANHDPEKVKEVFFTSDGTAFVSNQFALMHAATLKDQEVSTVKRSEV